MSTINFTARLVSNPTIKERRTLFKYDDVSASIVELDNTNSADLTALNITSKQWENKGSKYVDDMSNIANNGIKETNIGMNHYYALTTQTKDFDRLEPNKILGLMMFHESNIENNEISILEVNPTTNKSMNIFRKYKKVGKSLVEYVKSKFPKKDIDVWADYGARGFYKKMGFIQNSSEACDLCWRAIK